MCYVFILILGLTLAIEKAIAIEVDDLYFSDILVPSQSEKDRKDAIVVGLEQVFVKVSGNSKVLQDALVMDQMKYADEILLQYQYNRRANDANEAKTWIHLEFDSQRVNQILNQANQPIWGKDRPFVIAWIISDDNQSLSAGGRDPDRQLLLARYLQQRGITLIQPILDIQELDQLEHLKRGYADLHSLQEISKRYGGKATLILKLDKPAENNWQSHWSIIFDNQVKNWDIQGLQLQPLFHQGVDLVSDSLAQRYNKVVNQDEKIVKLIMEDIDSISNYTKITQYLRNLSTIKAVKVLSVNGNKITYELVINGSEQTLVQTFTLNPMISAVDNDFIDSNILHYRMAL